MRQYRFRRDGDGTADCIDECDNDINKTAAGQAAVAIQRDSGEQRTVSTNVTMTVIRPPLEPVAAEPQPR